MDYTDIYGEKHRVVKVVKNGDYEVDESQLEEDLQRAETDSGGKLFRVDRLDLNEILQTCFPEFFTDSISAEWFRRHHPNSYGNHPLTIGHRSAGRRDPRADARAGSWDPGHACDGSAKHRRAAHVFLRADRWGAYPEWKFRKKITDIQIIDYICAEFRYSVLC